MTPLSPRASSAAAPKLRARAVVFVSVRDADKGRIIPAVRLLKEVGFSIVATGGTARYLVERGIPAQKMNKVSEGRPHIVDAIKNGSIALVFNTTEGAQALADFALLAPRGASA